MIGGVHVPDERGLAGHSDADVLLHAIADAILGAARLPGAEDIGALFPPNDPAFAGADSRELLAQVASTVTQAGYRILDVDSTVVAQAPYLSPYRAQMREAVAASLGVGVAQVGVKATTTEHLGYEGRGEGISAQAVALLEWCGAVPAGIEDAEDASVPERC
jgi:2-C-methyl-D-erythritol 2,4-cyclodiphosphate synthase